MKSRGYSCNFSGRFFLKRESKITVDFSFSNFSCAVPTHVARSNWGLNSYLSIPCSLNRCVPDNQRSYSLGFQFIFQRSLGFLPGPVMFGWMFDSLCLFWGESCGKRGRCQIYNIWRLSLGITVFGSALKGKCKLIRIHVSRCFVPIRFFSRKTHLW